MGLTVLHIISATTARCSNCDQFVSWDMPCGTGSANDSRALMQLATARSRADAPSCYKISHCWTAFGPSIYRDRCGLIGVGQTCCLGSTSCSVKPDVLVNGMNNLPARYQACSTSQQGSRAGRCRLCGHGRYARHKLPQSSGTQRYTPSYAMVSLREVCNSDCVRSCRSWSARKDGTCASA
jgi:hypothetical protein